MDSGLSDRLSSAIVSEAMSSADMLDGGIPLSRRVLVLGAYTDGLLDLGELEAASEQEMLRRIGLLVTGAMLNTSARELVVTEPCRDGTFITYGMSRCAHAGIRASMSMPFDEASMRSERWSDEHAAVLQSWIPSVPSVLTGVVPELVDAMYDVAPGGRFELTQVGTLVSGFNFEPGHA